MAAKYKKRIFSSLAVLLLIIGLVFAARSGITTISDDDVPMAGGQVPATFYVYNPSYKNIWTFFCDYVGEGTISERVEVDNDADYVNSIILSAPDYSASYPGYYIEWRTIYLMRNKTYVVGFFCDPPSADDRSLDEESTPTDEITEVDSEDVDALVDEVKDMIEEQHPDEVISEEETSETASAIVEANPEPITLKISREDILSAKPENYSDNTNLIWNQFRIGQRDFNDGTIPVTKLNDPVYCSMNLPSESRSDEMIKAWRDNGHITGDTNSPSMGRLLNFGAVEDTSGVTLPDTFSVYLGKMKMFAYSQSQQKWITLDSQPYPQGVYIYTLPWSTTKAIKCQNVTYFDDYIKVDLTKKELQGNCLHFWGKTVPLNNSDYLYYAASYEVWVSDNVVGALTASGGIDTKDSAGVSTLSQLYSTRGYSCTTYPKSIWGNTIPNSEYDATNATILNSMY